MSAAEAGWLERILARRFSTASPGIRCLDNCSSAKPFSIFGPSVVQNRRSSIKMHQCGSRSVFLFVSRVPLAPPVLRIFATEGPRRIVKTASHFSFSPALGEFMLTKFHLRKTVSAVLTIAAWATIPMFAANFALAQPAVGPKAAPPITPAPATGGSGSAATGAPAGTDPAAATAAAQKTPTEWLIENSVAKGTANTPQYQDITDAIIRFKNGDMPGARDLLRQARQKSQNKLPPVEVMIAKLLAVSNQPGPARAELERAVIADSKDPEPYLLFAEAALQDHRITDAAALLAKAKSVSDAYTDNLTRKRDFDIRINAAIANVYQAREQWEDAAKFLDAWLKIDPDNASAHQQMGRTLFQQGKANEARNEFAAAVKIDKNAVNPDIFLAQLYEEHKDHANAKKSVDAAIRMNPNDANVYLAAARWALATNQLADAQKFADSALKIKPDSVDAMISRGTIARMQGDLKTAESKLQEASMQAPGNLDASNQLALVLIEQDDPAKKVRAEQIAQNNMKMTTDGNRFSPEALTTAAWILYRQGRMAEAQQAMGRVLQTGQLSQDGAYYLARILEDGNRIDDALKLLQTAIDSPSPFAQRDKAAELLSALKAKQKEQASSKSGDSDKK
jgi:tetratricopeptide (TPR) repeat protein